MNYVLKERQNQDSNNSTTEASISEDLAGDIIIEGEFLESGEDSCSTAEDPISYDIKDVKSYTMNRGASGEIGNSATIMFQEVTIEEESRVNFGKKSISAGEMLINSSQCATSGAPAPPCYQTEDVCPRYIWCQVTTPALTFLRPSQPRNWPRSTRLELARHW